MNAVPFLNAGDVHKWVTGVFSDGDYAEAHQLIETSKPGSNGVLCLPYLVGERFPVMNPNIRGAYVGLDPDTAKADMMRSPMPIFCQQWQWPRWYSMYQTCCNQYANALYTSRILTPHAHMPTHTGDS